MSATADIIEIREIEKSYEEIRALRSISFSVKQGEIFGLIGPDGAGKTSLFRILATLLLPDKGTVTVMGLNAIREFKKLRKVLGYMPGRFSLYQDLTVLENLTFYATIFGTTIKENYHLIKDIYQQIEPFKNRRAGALSGGMKQKLALSCALIHKPELLILDEPTTGVDAISRREFWEMLMNLKRTGMTILVSTPYMDEAALCDRVALIQEGTILELDAPQHIIREFKKKILKIRSTSVVDLLRDLQQFEGTESVQPFGDFVHYIDTYDDRPQEELIQYLLKKGHSDIVVEPTAASIEDCFIHLMTQGRPEYGS